MVKPSFPMPVQVGWIHDECSGLIQVRHPREPHPDAPGIVCGGLRIRAGERWRQEAREKAGRQ